MRTENAALMKAARESLSGKWLLAIGVFLIYQAIVIAAGMLPKAGTILQLIISGPMILGLSIFSLNLSRNQEAKLEQLFKGFNNFVNSLAAYLLMLLFTFLWALLLIIPGIMAAFSYSMTFYILAENESMGAMEAIDRSKQIMKGNRWKLFCLQLRFIGWFLLCLLTLGIGFLWLVPYVQISTAKFYDDVKEMNLAVAENTQIQSA